MPLTLSPEDFFSSTNFARLSCICDCLLSSPSPVRNLLQRLDLVRSHRLTLSLTTLPSSHSTKHTRITGSSSYASDAEQQTRAPRSSRSRLHGRFWKFGIKMTPDDSRVLVMSGLICCAAGSSQDFLLSCLHPVSSALSMYGVGGLRLYRRFNDDR